MRVHERKHRQRRFIATSTFLLMLAACVPTQFNAERLDGVTGVTVSNVRTPITLSRDTPTYGAYARNFTQLGAIEVNRSGTHQYYLWLGIWNTVQVASTAEHRDGFESIILFIDGEPLALENRGWTPDAIGTSEAIYMKPVASAVDAYYQVSIDQVRLIANASDIRLRTTGNTPREFNLWDEQRVAKEDFADFYRRISE